MFIIALAANAKGGMIAVPVVPARPIGARPSVRPQRVKLPPWLKPILGGGTLLVTASAFYLGLSHIHAPPPIAAPDMRTGSIVILAPDMRQCRHLIFNNATGAIKDEGTGECNDSSDSAAARLGQVSDSFQHR
jgi:hypothetical protein